MTARACIIPVFVPHLGCPHQCVFCDQKQITGCSAGITVETVRSAIRAAEAAAGCGTKRQLAFYGGSFTAMPEAMQTPLLEAAAEAIADGQIDSARLSTRPDAVTEGILRRLVSYGVDTVELGAQSMDDDVLRLSRRGHSAADVERASRLVHEAGLSLILQMMTGLPGDTAEKSMATARRLIALRPEGVRIYPTVVVKGTDLYDMWVRGEYREHTLPEAVQLCAALYDLFDWAGIPIIRLGLNPNEQLSGGGAAAGAYHPAFGELVRSRRFFERACRLLDGVRPGSRVVLAVRPRLLSQVLGQRRENLRLLREQFALTELKILPDETITEDIVVLSAAFPE